MKIIITPEIRKHLQLLGILSNNYPKNNYPKKIIKRLREKAVPLFPADAVTIDIEIQHLKDAYRIVALHTHPDKNRNDPQSEDKFKALGQCYEKITEIYNTAKNAVNPDSPSHVSPNEFRWQSPASMTFKSNEIPFPNLKWPNSVNVYDCRFNAPIEHGGMLFFKLLTGNYLRVNLYLSSDQINTHYFYRAILEALIDLNPEITPWFIACFKQSLPANFSENNNGFIASYEFNNRNEMIAPTLELARFNFENIKLPMVWVSMRHAVSPNTVINISDFYKYTIGGHLIIRTKNSSPQISYFNTLSAKQKEILKNIYTDKKITHNVDIINNFKAEFSNLTKGIRTLNGSLETRQYWHSLGEEEKAMLYLAISGRDSKLKEFITDQNDLFLRQQNILQITNGEEVHTPVMYKIRYSELSPQQQLALQNNEIMQRRCLDYNSIQETWDTLNWSIQQSILSESSVPAMSANALKGKESPLLITNFETVAPLSPSNSTLENPEAIDLEEHTPVMPKIFFRELSDEQKEAIKNSDIILEMFKEYDSTEDAWNALDPSVQQFVLSGISVPSMPAMPDALKGEESRLLITNSEAVVPFPPSHSTSARFTTAATNPWIAMYERFIDNHLGEGDREAQLKHFVTTYLASKNAKPIKPYVETRRDRLEFFRTNQTIYLEQLGNLIKLDGNDKRMTRISFEEYLLNISDLLSEINAKQRKRHEMIMKALQFTPPVKQESIFISLTQPGQIQTTSLIEKKCRQHLRK